MASRQKKSKKIGKRKSYAAASSFSSASAAKRTRVGGPESVARTKAKLSNVGDGANLFESQWTKRKFEILGRKSKLEGRRAGLSRSAAIDKRKKTILQEFQSRGKANVFLDHRFGERDEGLTEEDKAILRFQRERQAKWQKRSKFTLHDEDEEAVLTHGGTTLSELDDFEENSFEEDDESEHLEELVKNFHFGGDSPKGLARAGDDQSEKKSKSKKEIMEEIIAKSKFYKAQKAKEKEKDAELKDQLDKDFAALAQSQALSSLVRSKKCFGSKSTIDQGNEGKADDFDKLVKEMGMEMRAHASDRLKTDEEIAGEERAQLEELEEKRRKRMLDEESEDSESENTAGRQDSQITKRRRLELSGDDLGENFANDDDDPKKGWVDEVLARNEEGEEEDLDSEEEDKALMNEDSDSDTGSEEESEEREVENDAWEESDDEVLGAHGKTLSTSSPVGAANTMVIKEEALMARAQVHAAKTTKPSRSMGELPFVIEAPKNLQEFKSLVDGRPITDLLVIIQRIRTCNSIRLAAENRRKMQVFYGVLLQYFASVAGGRVPSLDRLNALMRPLIEMGSETPYFSAVCARERIIRMREQFIERLKSQGVDGLWPSCKSLALFRLWTLAFPPSDFRHVVLTPCTLLMAEYLTRSPVKSARDLTVGTFICGLLLSIMRPARRFCPEALSFLYAALISALSGRINTSKAAAFLGCGSFMLELVSSQPWLRLQNDCSHIRQTEDLEFDDVMATDKDPSFFETDTFRLSVLSCILGTLEGFSHLYEEISCYPEIFDPFISVLEVLSVSRHCPQAVIVSITRLLGQIRDNVRKTEKLRQPLRMRVKKPAPIKQFNPKFEENFIRGRNYDPDKERAEGKRLRQLIKQEAKGAARELRKDNYFLQAEKAKEKALVEEQREENLVKGVEAENDDALCCEVLDVTNREHASFLIKWTLFVSAGT
ncbi:hypothetical protein GOP47_0028353 [Adiantum capillus-veneris]|nr:hypothetical protein GOP47_0028353 [Adiantum capillus-veneris]